VALARRALSGDLVVDSRDEAGGLVPEVRAGSPRSEASGVSGSLPDAAPANWVDRHAPGRLKPWLKLGRFDRPTGIWLLMLPGWQGVALAAAMGHRWPEGRLLVLFAAGSGLMRAAGCAYNDIVDRDIDAKVARTAARPIASGQISVGAAWLFILACCAASLVILIEPQSRSASAWAFPPWRWWRPIRS